MKSSSRISDAAWKLLSPIKEELKFTKNDPLDLRWGDVFSLNQLNSIEDHQFVVIGYRDERGIINNKGRAGAKDGPDGIRNYLYRMTHLPVESLDLSNFKDWGNWDQRTLPTLEDTQDLIKESIFHFHLANNTLLTLGGGHDYAYPDVHGFIQAEIKRQQRPLVINFDAHLDVRSDEKGINSGTPFYKILKEFHSQIDFYEIGIQLQCNSDFHIHFVRNHSGRIITIEDIQNSSLNSHLKNIYHKHSQQPLFVSLDIDVLCSTDAPGCSQSWPSGLMFRELSNAFHIIKKFNKWNHLGIYEVAPILDINGNTQRAAALFAYDFLHHYVKKS